MDNEQGWQRLAAAVRARRDQRGWTQLDVATRGPLSIDRIQAIEGARTDRYSSRILAKLEHALEWAPGSCRDTVAGGDPTPQEVSDGAAASPEPRDPVAELTERLERLEQAAARHRQENDELRRMLQQITGKDSGSAGHTGGELPESKDPHQAM